MSTSRRLPSAGLVALLTASSALAQSSRQPVQPPPAEPPVASIPLGPDDRTEYAPVELVARSGSTEQELVRVVAQASGCRVAWISKTQTLALTGTPKEIELAKATLEKLTADARAMSERRAVQAKAQAEAEKPNLFNVDFAGGTVREYLKTIAERTGFTGFVMPDGDQLDALKLPAITLRNTDLRTTVELLASIPFATDDRGFQSFLRAKWVGSTPQGQSYDPSELESLLRSACVVSVTRTQVAPPQTAQVPRAAIERAAFDLAPLKGGRESEVQPILDAITLAIEMDGPSESFVAKFHEPSHLLIVRGTAAEVISVREIIALRVSPKVTRPPEPLPAKTPSLPSEERATPDNDVAALKQKLGEISVARTDPNLSEAAKTRLKEEFAQVLQQLKDAQQSKR